MTGKLLKYEIRSSVKIMAAVWVALIAASLLFSIASNFLSGSVAQDFEGASRIISIITGATGVMYFAVLMAMVIISIIIIILRFYRGLITDEGYLMHTLPVKPWQLITAKGIVATGIIVASMIVAFVSFVIIAGIGLFVTSLPDLASDIAYAVKKEPMIILLTVEVIILIVFGILKSIYQVYASLAIGQLAGKYRILLSVAAYIGINTVLTVLLLIVTSVIAITGIGDWFVTLADNVNQYHWLGFSQVMIGGLFLLVVLQLAVFHIITERILSLKLNLQ